MLMKAVVQNGEVVASFYETLFCGVIRKDLLLSALSLAIEQTVIWCDIF